MKKQEATQHAAVSAWMRDFLKTHHGCAIEVKHTRGKDSIPFSALEEHQRVALAAVFGNIVVHKLDDGGLRKLPFDLFGLAHVPAFVAVRYPDFIAIVAIHVWMQEEETSKRKSLTRERALELAYDVIRFGRSAPVRQPASPSVSVPIEPKALARRPRPNARLRTRRA